MGLFGSKNVIKEVKIFLRKIRDLIFPVFCLSCEVEGVVICDKCLEKIKVHPQFFCQGDSFLDGAMALGNYQEKILQKAILEYKYNFNKDVFVIFKKMFEDWNIFDFQEKLTKTNLSWVVVPVPLHQSRFWERGFNQAEEIAKEVSAKLGFSLNNKILQRIKKTKRQVGLGGLERQKNLNGAFIVSGDWSGQGVVLIDDVFTTGSTLQECAKTLKQGGVKVIWAVTLLREN